MQIKVGTRVEIKSIRGALAFALRVLSVTLVIAYSTLR